MRKNLHLAQEIAKFSVAGTEKMIHNMIHNDSLCESLEGR
jgi:hypothetical protein